MKSAPPKIFFRVRTLDCGATIRCSLFLWTIPVNSSFLFAVSPECRSCPVFFSGVVSLTLRKRGHRKIISHSDGHSVVNRQNKKPIHRNIKNRRERCSRFKMMFYVPALNFKDGFCLYAVSANRSKSS